MSIEHATFTVERTYEAPPTRVFAAWADPAAKAQWFGAGNALDLDFRVGGRETSAGEHEGHTYTYAALYQDIVDDERIVYTYDMHMGDRRISVSVATVELVSAGDGTRLVFTEQAAFLDGLDNADQRAGGTGTLLDALGQVLSGERVA